MTDDEDLDRNRELYDVPEPNTSALAIGLVGWALLAVVIARKSPA